MNSRKKIAFFHNLPSGGGLRMIRNIIDSIKAEYRVDVFVISDITQSKIPSTTQYFEKIYPWKGFVLRQLWIYFKLPMIHKRLAEHINQNYDIAFLTHDYITKSPYLLRYLTIKKIYLCQEPQREFYESWKIHNTNLKDIAVNLVRFPIKVIDEKNVAYADVILSNSMYSKKVIKRVYKRDSDVIYPGVDTSIFKPKKRKKKNTILCVGGINQIKDQKFLVTSLNPLLEKYQLLLVGSGKEKYINELFYLVENKNNLVIYNNLSDKKLINLYQTSLVTCVTAHKEPFGLSSIESQACGTPVVVVDEGGVVETVKQGLSGFVVKKEIGEFRKKVQETINNNSSMGYYARKFILDKWSWKVTLKKLEMILK